LGEDGATHQILEDLGMMKMLPHMTVINPCDYNQTKAATIAIAEYEGPVYLQYKTVPQQDSDLSGPLLGNVSPGVVSI